jgi:hypothetical protein
MENQVLIVSQRSARVKTGVCLAAGVETMTFDLNEGATVNGQSFPW